jgi:hypothetical protein
MCLGLSGNFQTVSNGYPGFNLENVIGDSEFDNYRIEKIFRVSTVDFRDKSAKEITFLRKPRV